MAMFNFDFSPEAELRREIARRQLEDLRSGKIDVSGLKSGRRQSERYEETNRQRDEAWAGMTALQEIRARSIEKEREKSYKESLLPTETARNPEQAARLMAEIKIAGDELKDLKAAENIKQAETFFRFVDSSRAPSMTAQYVAQMVGMKNPKIREPEDYVEMSEESTDPNTGKKTVKKWRERPDNERDYLSYGEIPVAAQDSQAGQAFTDYQTGLSPTLTQSGYSSGYGQAGSSNYLAGVGQSYFPQVQPEISAPAEQSTMQAPVAATPMQSSDEKSRALDAYNKAQTPQAKEKIRQTAASRGIQIP